MNKFITFVFFLTLSINVLSKEYLVKYIPLDTDFFTPTTLDNFSSRAIKVFKLKSKNIDNLFADMEKRCSGSPVYNEPRVIVEYKKDRIVVINSDKTLVFIGKCTFESSIKNAAIDEIEGVAKRSK